MDALLTLSRDQKITFRSVWKLSQDFSGGVFPVFPGRVLHHGRDAQGRRRPVHIHHIHTLGGTRCVHHPCCVPPDEIENKCFTSILGAVLIVLSSWSWISHYRPLPAATGTAHLSLSKSKSMISASHPRELCQCRDGVKSIALPTASHFSPNETFPHLHSCSDKVGRSLLTTATAWWLVLTTPRLAARPK